MAIVKLTIDGKEVTAEQGTTIMKAAEAVGIHIPRFCYHPGLSIAGNCRICLVEVEKMPKLVTSCSTSIGEGMVVHTNNEKVRKARQGVLELMLSEHPLDCPICDQAGECSLQDYYMSIGLYKGRFAFEKHHKPKKVMLKPHLVLDAERCILCARCVRFCQEITKTGEFAIGWRGNHAEIDTFEHRGVENGYAGNLHEICPVGALTSADFRFRCRVWWLRSHESICPGCSTGCSIYLEEKDGIVYRLRARENQEVNQYWLCDEGRYNYKFVNAPDRLAEPQIRKGEKLAPASWADGLALIHSRFTSMRDAGEKIAGIANAQLTNEEHFLFRKYMKEVLKSELVDYRIDESHQKIAEKEDGLLLRGDKNPNTRGAELMGLGAGISAREIIKQAADGSIAGLYLLGPERIVSGELMEALKAARPKIKFVVMQASRKCDLLSLADVVLAGATFAEKEGSFTNYEGRIQRLCSALPLYKNCKTDLEIFAELLSRSGKEIKPLSAGSVFRLLASEIQPFSGIEFEQLPQNGMVIKVSEE